MNASTVTVKGQVVIPAEMRRKYRIGRGTRVVFYDKGGELRLVPVTPEAIDANVGFLRTRGRLRKALAAEKSKERAL
jgi:AbrB family looped-hinge helix DNA binding protein